MQKEVIHSKGAPEAVGPYEQAIRVGSLVYTSGQIPLDPATGSLVCGSIEDASERVILNLQAVLEAAGAPLSRVIKTTVYLTDMTLFARFNAVYDRYFGASRPARSCVQAASLPKGASVEIEAVALAGDANGVIAVFVTVPSGEEGVRLARGLVESGLTVCVNIVPSVRSIYLWEGRVCDAEECVLMIKTTEDRFERLSDWVQGNHSYELPEIIAVPVSDGSKKYLDWVRTSGAGKQRPGA